MRHLRFASLVSLVSLALALGAGCGDDDGPAAGLDAGRVDSGGGTGDGGRADGGPAIDAATMDAGAAPDAGGRLDAGRESCDATPTFSCATGTAGGACGDTLSMPECVAGGWACPTGTIDSRLCACIGRPPGSGCVCTAAGWACDVDGGAFSCAGSPGACFACGPSLSCVKDAEYCQEISGGPAGSEPSYSCPALPDTCPAPPTCACLTTGGGTFCSIDADGNITVRIAAP